MEITCPRCDSTFSVDAAELRAHDCQAQCSVCDQIFTVDGALCGATPSPAGAGRRWAKRFLLFIIFLLILALIGQAVWWTQAYSYLAGNADLRRAMLGTAQRLGVEIPWPGPNKQILIVNSQVIPGNGNLARITGTIRNTADFVQAYPVISVTLDNIHGAPVAHLRFTPRQYLAPPYRAADGFIPHTPVPFVLSSPQLITAPGYQVTLISQR